MNEETAMTRVDETTQDAEGVVAEVRERYGRIAETAGSCCGPTTKASTCCGGAEAMSLQVGYGKKDLAALPEGADLGLGCGAPVALLELKPGETVVDLGSGAGIDAFLAAREVGPSGRVIGVDMTPQMLERARRNAATTGHTNVEFREGRLEALPVEDGSVDAVTSNCVINLVPDKTAVFREVARVLKPGGRMVVADIVLDAPLPEAVVQDLSAWVGCVSGAMRRDEYIDLVESSGLESVEALRDVDQGAAMELAAPEQTRGLLERTGTRREDLMGRVRSVTFRAVKPA
jgi:SAM-dependent methyltransferase